MAGKSPSSKQNGAKNGLENGTKIDLACSAPSKQKSLQRSGPVAIVVSPGEDGAAICSKAKSYTAAIDKLKTVRRRVRVLPLDWICLCAVLVVVWGLLLMPIIYFHTEIVSIKFQVDWYL